MSYEKIGFVDGEVRNPLTFNIKNNEDGTITLEPKEQIVIEGTKLNAKNLDHMEDGIYNNSISKVNNIDDSKTYGLYNTGVGTSVGFIKVAEFVADGSFRSGTFLFSHSFYGLQHWSSTVISFFTNFIGTNKVKVDILAHKANLDNTVRFFYRQTDNLIEIFVRVTGGNGAGLWTVSNQNSNLYKLELKFGEYESSIPTNVIEIKRKDETTENINKTIEIADLQTELNNLPKCIKHIINIAVKPRHLYRYNNCPLVLWKWRNKYSWRKCCWSNYPQYKKYSNSK